ncbi:MAG TPA: peptidylprolyl isomerase [Methylomirabilota bacterium]|nr:peptidylprolyl isomerase [Methylomirabilota bacterium]
MRRRACGLLMGAAVLAGGCAIPSWVPLLGTSGPPPGPPVAAKPKSPDILLPGDLRVRPVTVDDTVQDRVIAVVNNDAITLGELQETMMAYRNEARQKGGSPDEDLAKQLLPKIIDNRLQLQEADREKITVEDAEVNEELAERVKSTYGAKTVEEFERLIKEQGVTMDAVRKRLRDSLRVAKVIRRKVALRVSVTDPEVAQYLEENRAKLETGLSYHARHILLTPEDGAAEDAAWEAARIKAQMLRTQLEAGADFAEMARQQSKDASGKDGGDLGTLKRGELSQEIEAEILKLSPGQVSAPYRSPLGYHLFKLESKDSLEGDGLVRVKQQIREILFREKYETRLETWLKEIKQRAIIEVRM